MIHAFVATTKATRLKTEEDHPSVLNNTYSRFTAKRVYPKGFDDKVFWPKYPGSQGDRCASPSAALTLQMMSQTNRDRRGLRLGIKILNLNYSPNSLPVLFLFSFSRPRVRPTPEQCLPRSASKGNFSGANLATTVVLIPLNLEASPSTSRRIPFRQNLYSRRRYQGLPKVLRSPTMPPKVAT